MATNCAQLPSYPVTQPIGFGIIIVNKFQNIPSHTRRGAEREIENFSNLFSLLGLHTKVYEDLTSHQIVQQLVSVSRDPVLSSHSLLAVAISSHGNEEGLFGRNIEERLQLSSEGRSCSGLNDVISSLQIQTMFNSKSCPLLEGKPKLLLLNGCRGGEKEGLYGYEKDGRATEALPTQGSTVWSDFLVVWSAVDGYQSVRHVSTGSVFISVLCEVLERLSGYSLEQLMPVVNQKLIERTTRFCEKESRMVAECCVWTSTLKRQLCLHSSKSRSATFRLSFEEAVDLEVDEFPCIESLHSISLNSISIADSLTLSGSDPTTCIAIANTTFLDITKETASKLKIGDRVLLLDMLDSKKNLLFIRSVSSMDTGYVPRNVIKPDEDLETEIWFRKGMDKKSADTILSPCPDGTFLVRSSIINPYHYRLVIVSEHKVHQYKIKYLPFDWMYILSVYHFSSLSAMVSYLSHHRRVCCKLAYPYTQQECYGVASSANSAN